MSSSPALRGERGQHAAKEQSGTREAKRYKPQAVKRVEIPKANGGVRPSGIPTVRDRVVQTAAKLILEPVFEAANLYLHRLDRGFYSKTGPSRRANARLVRYADDFTVLARYQGGQLQNRIEERLETRFGLQINRDKTKTVKLREVGESLDFPGYTFRYDKDLKGRNKRYPNLMPSRKACSHLKMCMIST